MTQLPVQCEIIRVWTVQPWEVWEAVESRGALAVDPRFSANLHRCYEWLQAQLLRRLPGYTGHYPWWAYGTRPDLRRVRHQQPYGARRVLIELDLPTERVMVFPFWAWDCIFYERFLSPSRRESEDWKKRLLKAVPNAEDTDPLPEPWQTELEASWERLFDPKLPARGWLVGRAPPLSEREVVFEVLDRGSVRRVTPFVGAR
jgi:Domain of unknown function (DUF3841)